MNSEQFHVPTVCLAHRYRELNTDVTSALLSGLALNFLFTDEKESLPIDTPVLCDLKSVALSNSFRRALKKK